MRCCDRFARCAAVIALGAALVLGLGDIAAAQERPAIQPDDYGQWERLGFRTPLSPDGAWLAAPVTRVDGTLELRVYAVAGGHPVVVPGGTAPVFADSSTWVGCAVRHSEAEAEALRKAKEPVRQALGLLRLGDAEPEIIDRIESFAFGAGGAYLAMKRYGEEEAAGADLIVRNLASGVEIGFGNVAEYAWQDEGSMLALAIGAADRAGNGVQLYDADTGVLQVLESGDADFRDLIWRKDSADLAFLRSVEDDGYEEPTHEVVVWRQLGSVAKELRYVPVTAAGFPAGMRVSEGRDPSFSDDGATLFFGIREWHPKDLVEESSDVLVTDPSMVEVWHTHDEQIVPMQKARRQRNRDATYLAAWHLDDGGLVRLGTDLAERVTVLEGQRYAVETDRTPYRFDNMFDRDWHDIWLIDVGTGERRRVIESVGYFYGGSAQGRYLLYFKDDQFGLYDIQSDLSRTLTTSLPVSFVNDDYDTPVWRQQPPWGYGGWLADDSAVLLYDRYDVWAVMPGGTGALRVSDGAGRQVRHRVVDLDPEQPGVDPHEVIVSTYGEWTKQSGYSRVALGGQRPRAGDASARGESLVWLDKSVGRLAKATSADVYSYRVQGYDDSPDVFVGGPDLTDAHQVTATNPFQTSFAWGRSELLEYESTWGRRLQGALFYPANYDPDKKYPMIVYVYERLSQTVHGYTVPSERSPYNTSVWNAEGYFVLRPDIVYRNRRPGTSAVDCIVPAVQAVIATGRIDAERVGLAGHSWGGYEASYVPTRTDVFAASVAGAALTNFFSMFGTIHWNQGLPETDHFETGQARMEVPYWDDTEAYLRESPVAHITDLQTPMLLFAGDEDGTVDWHQSIEMYNYARRAGKQLVLLVYPGENHSARRRNNQVDYHRRVLQWFGHYLKNEPAPEWVSNGVPVLERDRQLRALRQR